MIGGTYCALQRVAAEDVQWGVEVIEDGPGVGDRRRGGGGGAGMIVLLTRDYQWLSD